MAVQGALEDMRDALPPPPESFPVGESELGSVPDSLEIFSAALMDLMGPMGEEGGWERDFWTEPVTVVSWFRDFLRQPLWPEQEKAAVAIFGEDPREWRAPTDGRELPWEEILLFIGKGGGKSDLIAGAFSFAGYWLRNRKDPWAYFGKTPGDNVDLINVAFNARQAKNVFFRKLKAKMRKATDPATGKNWFRQMGVDLREGGKHIQGRIVYLDDDRTIAIHAGDSMEYTGEGLNILMALFDELGAFGKPEKALALYGALKDTGKTRFRSKACAVAISYQYSAADAMTFLVTEASKEQQVPAAERRTFVMHKATWEMNPTVRKTDFASEYAKNPERAKRVFECRGKAVGANAFFKYPEEIRTRANRKRVSPLAGEAWWTDDLMNVQFQTWFRGAPGAEYHVHADLASGGDRKDKIGLVMGREFRKRPSYSEDYVKALLVAGSPEPPRPLDEEPAIWYDLMLQVRAKTEEGEVRFQDLIDFVDKRLRRELGFNVTLMTYDGWQSKGEQQRVRERGIASETLSCDKTAGPAETLKGLIYSGLADYYAHPVFMREGEELVEEGGKIDHPRLSTKRAEEEGDNRGSKDVWDGAAGVAESFRNPAEAGKGYRLGF